MYAANAGQKPGIAVVSVVFGWAPGVIHGKCLMLLQIDLRMTADMDDLTCLYIVISGHQM